MTYEKTILQMDVKELRKKIWQLWGTIERLQDENKHLKKLKAPKDSYKEKYLSLLSKYKKLDIEVKKTPVFDNTLDMINHFYGVDIRLRSRKKEIVKARQVYFFVMYVSGHSLCSIGRQLKLDHSTVIHGRDKIIANFELLTNEEKEFIQSIT